MDILENFQDQHHLHGIAIGGAVYYVTDKPLFGLASAVSWYYYMSKYGHTLPFTVIKS
jgi:hypothetical protein